MPVLENPVGMTLDRIMVATDFTAASEAATKYATLLAKRFSSKVTLTHVVDLSVATRSEDAVVGLPIDQMRKSCAESMERTLSDLAATGIDAHGQTLESHNPATAVVELATQVKSNLLIVGTHDRHGLNKMILGSAAEGIIRHAHCPVMVIGPKVKIPSHSSLEFGSILFATDLRHDTAKKAALALSFAHACVANMYLCHVLREPGKDFSDAIDLELKTEAALQQLIPQSSYNWCASECLVEQGNAGRHIVEVSSRISADLIIMGAKRSTTWFTHLSGGAVGYVVSHASCPVLTICSD
jgi:nucleotide-binding universal stress UspA family protein